jgi:hypothetical protein
MCIIKCVILQKSLTWVKIRRADFETCWSQVRYSLPKWRRYWYSSCNSGHTPGTVKSSVSSQKLDWVKWPILNVQTPWGRIWHCLTSSLKWTRFWRFGERKESSLWSSYTISAENKSQKVWNGILTHSTLSWKEPQFFDTSDMVSLVETSKFTSHMLDFRLRRDFWYHVSFFAKPNPKSSLGNSFFDFRGPYSQVVSLSFRLMTVKIWSSNPEIRNSPLDWSWRKAE